MPVAASSAKEGRTTSRIVIAGTNQHAGHVVENAVSPAMLAATIFHHLGIDPATEYIDEIQQQRHRLSDAQPIRNLG